MTIASESGHWYDREGNPTYQVPNASKGGFRDTTLKDARKLHLVPSVTAILNVASKPALTRYFVEQAYLAMATLPEVKGESVEDRIRRAKLDAGEHSKQARERGTYLHSVLERSFKGQLTQQEQVEFAGMIDAVQGVLFELFGEQKWIAERSFSHPLGYGGKVDLYCPEAVVDFKAKELKDKQLHWPEQAMQLDAYRNGLGIPSAMMVNLYIDRDNPELVRFHVWDEGDWFERFKCLLRYWQLEKGYDSSF